jgi:F0F1-type ATP synthase membrane subunit b/b'
MLTFLWNNRYVKALGLALGLLLGVILYGTTKKREGQREILDDLVQEDIENALRIREQADKDQADVEKDVAKLDSDAVNDSLRKHGKLRD